MSTATPRVKVGKLSLVFLQMDHSVCCQTLSSHHHAHWHIAAAAGPCGCSIMRWPRLVVAEPVMDPPRHWQTAADPRGCIMDPVMTRLDIAKLPRVFEDGA